MLTLERLEERNCPSVATRPQAQPVVNLTVPQPAVPVQAQPDNGQVVELLSQIKEQLNRPVPAPIVNVKMETPARTKTQKITYVSEDSDKVAEVVTTEAIEGDTE